jgi:hypothetical protein
MERERDCKVGLITEVLENSGFEYMVVDLVKKKSGTLDWSRTECFRDKSDMLDFYYKEGAVYFFVVKDLVLKIGQTDRTVIKRLEDYNKGRNSEGTEGFVMKYLKNCNSKVKLYVVYPEGEISFGSMVMPMSSASLEDAFIKTYFSKFGCLPILNKGFC